MQTQKEAILAMMKGEKTDFIPDYFKGVKEVVYPGDRWMDLEDPYSTGPDAWGVRWTSLGPDPFIDGTTIEPGFTLFEEMDEWKEKVKFPSISLEEAAGFMNGMKIPVGYNENEHALSVLFCSGTFERMNELVGMENALTAFYEYPDEVHEFFEAMCEYKLQCIEKAYEAVHPDIIHMHDDWGAEKNMMFSPDLWREFIKPNETRYTKKIHELGMIYQHHSCGYISQVIPDLVEIGVDVIDPFMAENDQNLIFEYGDRITFAGGLNNRIFDGPGTTPEERLAELQRGFDSYGNKGLRSYPYYIPTDRERFAEYKANVEKLTQH